MTDPARLYLDLLKKSLLGELYYENEVRLLYLRDCLEGRDRYDPRALLRIEEARRDLCQRYRALGTDGRLLDDSLENLGYRHTMIGRRRLEHLEWCLGEAVADGVPGDFIECGVLRGGAAVFMRGYLEAHGVPDRVVWVADSFAGLPAPSLPEDASEAAAAACPALAVPLDIVRGVFSRYGLADARVRFLPGWFRDTLPGAPIGALAVLRVDADLYESTATALAALYGKVSPGGFVIIDDYHCIDGCRQAVDRFRRERRVAGPLERIDWTGVYWRKR